MGMNELGTLGICIDEYDSGEMRGRIFSYLKEEPYEFTSAISLVKTISNIFDQGDYPQATMRCRLFGKETDSTAKNMQEFKLSDPRHYNFSRITIRGKKATFRVKVMFRQNASWQGTITWVDQNKEENFRSALEMLMLIDSSFEAQELAAEDSDSLEMAK